MACDPFARKTQKHIKHIGCLSWLELELKYLLIDKNTQNTSVVTKRLFGRKTQKHVKHKGSYVLGCVGMKNTKTHKTHASFLYPYSVGGEIQKLINP